MSKQNTDVTVFYGEQPTHPHERRAINIVRNELARRGISATLLANFTVVANSGRQIDLVIITDHRCLIVELKLIDPALPLIATPNGPWRQVLPDGTERPLDRGNFYDQAIQQTYGLSDTLAGLEAKGLVPGPQAAKFFRHIDTVVCLDPRIPDGSTTPRHRNVSVVGLDELIDRVAQAGPGLTHWTPEHWGELIRHLGLYAESDDDPAVIRRRADTAAIQDYRRRFREFTAAAMPPLVAATALIDGQSATVDATTLAAQLSPQRSRVLLAGESGNGKTHLAKHTAITLTDDGQTVLWVPADDYEKDRLRRSLARAVGPFSTEKVDALLAKATETGTGITLIIDALEKCGHQEELLKQLHALQQQHPVSVLVTTTDTMGTEPLAPTSHVDLAAPNGEERTRLATIYGTADGVAESGQYRTRYAVTLAAQVITELGTDATTTDVMDSYVRRRTQNETVRAGLRCLAAAMDDGVRTVLTISEAMLILRRCQPMATTPSAIDDTLSSQLVRIHQGRLRFDHEQLGRFLTAEHLVLSADDGASLAQLLKQPAHQDLRGYALLLESNPGRRYDTIRHLADARLIADAARGSLGEETAKHARAEITELLIHATATAADATFSVEDPESTSLNGTWHDTRQWTPIEGALLTAAGHCTRDGLFLHEIGALMDATDVAVRKAMRELHAAGSKVAISTVIASTFARSSRRGTPAAGLITAGTNEARVFRHDDTTPVPTATPMWQPKPRCYGRLYMAALLSHPVRHPDDAAALPDLVETGLSVGGYHLRLELIQAAQFGCRILEFETRQQMIDVLNSVDTNPYDWGTNSSLIEALASYDQITPITTLEDIQRSIAELLVDPDHPDYHRLAQGMVASMFEDERVLGPYNEAIDTLPEQQRLTLFAMSVLHDEHSFIGTPYALRHLADGARNADGIVGRALARYAGAVPDDTFARGEVVASHLHGLQGWARISSTLPKTAEPAEPLAIGWRLVDELLLLLLRGHNDAGRAAAIWEHLRTELPHQATAILCDIYRARVELVNYGDLAYFEPYQALLAAYPDQVRELLEWALSHRDELTKDAWDPMGGIDNFVVRTLGRVGTAQTANVLRHHYVHDTQLGRDAIDAVHAIEARTQK